MSGDVLQTGVVLLGAALICVPIAKYLGIGSVLGYLIAGILIGPYLIGFIGKEGEDIMHASEFGVVMMLFVIGLELTPESFWRMRRAILGLGLSQMLLSSLGFFALFYAYLHLSWTNALSLALALSMSSTAIVLQTLKEKNLSLTEAGQSSFAVLLLQDIAVIPVLALLPVIAGDAAATDLYESPLLSKLPSQYRTLLVMGVAAIIYFMGRFLINPMLRRIARTGIRELFTASALFIVMLVAWIAQLAGISAALGTFMAGVMLANSEFRHQLESDVEPFKGILMGLFFTAVGSTINFTIIVEKFALVFGTVFSVMLVKALVLLLIGYFARLQWRQNLQFALLLSQVGEFAFVLLNSAGKLQVIDPAQLDFFMAVSTLSMLISPVLLYLSEKLLFRSLPKEKKTEQSADHIAEHNRIIIAGFGHFGSTLGRFLRANGENATILDHDSKQVELLRKLGFKVYYGDATRLDLLRSAGAEKAEILVSAIDSLEQSLELAELASTHFPHLKIFVRTKNRYEAYEFVDRGHQRIYRESLHDSVHMGVDVLSELGHRRYTASRKAAEFIQYDNEALRKLAGERHEMDRYIVRAKEEIELQEKLLSEDAKFADFRSNSAWDQKKRQE